MNPLMLITLLITTSLAQIINKLPIKLSDLAKNPPPDTLQLRAINYLMQMHPEFADYNVTVLNTAINRTNQYYADNLKDYLFQLNSTNNRIRALVTLSDLTNQRYVSISPLTCAPPFPPRGKFGPINEYSVLKGSNRSVIALNGPIINYSISSNSKNNSPMDSNNTKKIAINSYNLFQNQQDPLIQFAMDYIASQRPNIINYNLTSNIFYQLVAGLNIKIQYVGYDNYTRVTAVVNFDLKLKPTIVSFEVECLYLDPTCREQQVWRIYESIETILMFHPQLFAFRLTNVRILEPMTGDSPKMRVMLTFENSAQKLRSLLEQEIVTNKVNLLSFYTYSYEQ